MQIKSILLLGLGSVLFSSLLADLLADSSSKTYVSPYSDKSVGKGFNISHKYGYSEVNQNYYIQFSDMQRDGNIYSTAMHPYKQNLRVFLPPFASSFSFYIKRYYWDGYFSIVSKFGTIPNESLTSSDTDLTDYMNKLISQSVVIYSDKSKPIEDPNFFNYLLQGKSTYHFKVDYGVDLRGQISKEDSKIKLNRWLYVLTDTTQIYGYRNLLLPTTGNNDGGVLSLAELNSLNLYQYQSSSSQSSSLQAFLSQSSSYQSSSNSSSSSLSLKQEKNEAVVGAGWLMLNFSTGFYKELVDEYVAKYLSPIEQNPNYKFCSNPSRYVLGEYDLNRSINLCIYITSFGADGNDSNYSTHYLTGANFKEKVDFNSSSVPSSIKMILPEIKKGWNLLGNYSSQTINLGQLFTDEEIGAKWLYTNNEWLRSKEIPSCKGFWVRSNNDKNTNFIDVYDISDCIAKYKNDDSWQLLAINKEINIADVKKATGASKIWAYLSGEWKSDDNVLLPKGSGVWIKGSSLQNSSLSQSSSVSSISSSSVANISSSSSSFVSSFYSPWNDPNANLTGSGINSGQYSGFISSSSSSFSSINYTSSLVAANNLTWDDAPYTGYKWNGFNNVEIDNNTEYKRMTWQEAKSFCSSMGKRLPTVNELINLHTSWYQSGKTNLKFINHNFGDTWYWSSEEDGNLAKFVDTFNSVAQNNKELLHNVRCVK